MQGGPLGLNSRSNKQVDYYNFKTEFVLMCSVVHGRWREAKAIKASFEDELCVSLNDALVFFLLKPPCRYARQSFGPES